MHWRFVADVFVYVIAHLFDISGHGLGRWRVMPAFAYFYLIDAKCTGKWIESLNGDSI